MRNDPIVLLGMHRSGTTLLAKILLEFNVHMGHRNGKLIEAEFFTNINSIILELFHAFWDFPSNVEYYLEPDGYPSRKISDLLYKWMNSLRFFKSYVGVKNYRKFYNSSGIVWGWKDPRTTITWPLWLNIFKSPKFIFIYRNGVDVAESLKKAEKNSQKFIGARNSSLRAISLEGGFDIWEEYNNIYKNLKKKFFCENIIEICYEELLSNPNDKLKEIIDFIEIDVSKRQLTETSAKIDASRMFSFTKNERLYEFYKEKRKNPLMKKLGYDKIQKD
jgi:hypothetical protein